MFNFERLEVWQKAIVFADTVYDLTRAFPEVEMFGLSNQLRRAASSISSNIAEGSARSPAGYSRFLGYATCSLYEAVSQMFIARRRRYLDETAFKQLSAEADEIARMRTGLRRSLGE